MTAVVTGLGALTCHGRGTKALWDAMLAAPVRLPDRVTDPAAEFPLPLMYLVDDADLPADVSAPGRASRLGIAVAREAFADAGLDPAPARGRRVGVVIGTCMGETGELERRRAAESPIGPGWDPAFPVAAAVAGDLGLPAATSVSNACAAGGFALGIALDMIRAGEAEVVLTGAADAYSRIALACFNQMRAVDPVRCRPFDRNRDGTVFGEGAAMLVVESAEHAARRGARAYARLSGAGWSCDAHHPTAPEPSGEQVGRAIRTALREAGDGPDVGCVIPHGTGTRRGDVVESQVLQGIFGVRRPPLYSMKALVGHTGGAAAALAAVAASLILHHREVPPNVAVAEQDPECDVHLPEGAPSALSGGRVVVNACAFGGNNAAVVLEAAS